MREIVQAGRGVHEIVGEDEKIRVAERAVPIFYKNGCDCLSRRALFDRRMPIRE